MGLAVEDEQVGQEQAENEREERCPDPEIGDHETSRLHAEAMSAEGLSHRDAQRSVAAAPPSL